MARAFRYYGKKRGHRRTGSPKLGSVGEAAFFAALLLLGCGGLVWLFSTLILPEWRVNHEFVETTCKVLDKRIGEMQADDGPLYRPEFKIAYTVGGATYRDWRYDIWHYDTRRGYSSGRENSQAILDRFAVYDAASGNRCPCWYDPMNPSVVVLVRGYRWWVWPLFTVPASFIIIGAGGLVYTLLRWGKSAERRSAVGRRAGPRDFFRPNGNGDRRYPFVPQGGDMTNSPGTKLKFRLAMAGAAGWALFGMLAFCVVWNGAVAVLAVMAIRGHLAGKPWLLTLFVVPFLLIGVGAIVYFLRRLLVAAGIGPTRLEISEHPLQPGGQYRLFFSQSGRLRIKALRVSLACEEAATYRQGTNARTETRQVYRQELFRREDFEISGQPFESDIELSLPAGAMHSFAADHNEINWTLVVEGEAAGWPNYRRAFPVIVRPAAGEPRP